MVQLAQCSQPHDWQHRAGNLPLLQLERCQVEVKQPQLRVLPALEVLSALEVQLPGLPQVASLRLNLLGAK
jgi:hypothetical protein